MSLLDADVTLCCDDQPLLQNALTLLECGVHEVVHDRRRVVVVCVALQQFLRDVIERLAHAVAVERETRRLQLHLPAGAQAGAHEATHARRPRDVVVDEERVESREGGGDDVLRERGNANLETENTHA